MYIPHSSSYFQVLQSVYQSCGDCTTNTNYNRYRHQYMSHCFFSFHVIFWYLSFFSFSFNFTLRSAETAKSKILRKFYYFLDYYKVWSSGWDDYYYYYYCKLYYTSFNWRFLLNSKILLLTNSFIFVFINTRSNPLIGWIVYISKPQWILCVSFSYRDSD